MSLYNYVRKAFVQSFKTRNEALKKRIEHWRKTPSVVRVLKPLNPLRARALGYKATQDYIVVRSRIAKGKRRKRRPDLGRKPGKNRKTEPPGLPLQELAQRRAAKHFLNLTPINSYFVGEDGQYKFYEVIFRKSR